MEQLENPINVSIPHPISLVEYIDGKFQVGKEAIELLSNDKYKNIGIISLVGKYRTGKSFLLNRIVLNKGSGFGVASTYKPCTKGIWLWNEPLMIKNSYSNETFPCFVVDTEGLGGYDEEINHDSKIYLIAIMISSLFVFNSFGPIDENSINTLSFVLNLSKSIKLRNDYFNDNDEKSKDELKEYFPNLLWLLRDFSLKLEDREGNPITEKQYLENSLKNFNGQDEIIENKNKVRELIRNSFPERDCFTMVRPVEKERDLQNLQNLPNDKLRKEFVRQLYNFREKLIQKTKPKMIKKKLLTGEMLTKFIESVVDAINNGGIPIIENSWRYIMQNECIRLSDNIEKSFERNLNEYRNKNKKNKNYAIEVRTYVNQMRNAELSKIVNNEFLDDDIKNEYIEKITKSLNEMEKLFNKENEKIFEQIFNDKLNEQSEIIISKLNKFTSHNQFFMDLDIFKLTIENSTPNFTLKKEYLYDKVMQIVQKYFSLITEKYEEENKKLKNTNELYIQNIKKITKELNYFKNEFNTKEINQLNDEIVNERAKLKNYETKIATLNNEKKIIKESFERQIEDLKKDFNDKINILLNTKNKTETELHLKEEQILIMRINSEKIQNLHQQKFSYLQSEIENLKEKYQKDIGESNHKEKLLQDEIGLLKAQNASLKTERKSIEKNVLNINNNNNNMDNYFNVIQDKFDYQNDKSKNYYEKILTKGDKKIKGVHMYKTPTKYNQNSLYEEIVKLNDVIDQKEKSIIALTSKLTSSSLYESIIENTLLFKCKNCTKFFPFELMKNHLKQCMQLSLVNDKIKENDIVRISISSNYESGYNSEYFLKVEMKDRVIDIKKSFNQFVNLYKTLKSLYRGVVEMPKSGYVLDAYSTSKMISLSINYNFNSNFSNQLEILMNDLLNIEIIAKSKPFLKFLSLE